MKIVFISDSHGMHNHIKIPECDVLVHCGDLTGYGTWVEVERFIEWLKVQPASRKIFIAGNHDRVLTSPGVLRDNPFRKELARDHSIYYLQDSSVVIEGVHFYGCPWTPAFMNWFFMYERNSEEAHLTWDLVPPTVDVLISHGMPHKILDRSLYQVESYPQDCGCEVFKKKVKEIRPQIVCGGHIHEARGVVVDDTLSTTYINASICTQAYRPINNPIVMTIKSKK